MDQTAAPAGFLALIDHIAPDLRPAPGDDAAIVATAGTMEEPRRLRLPIATLAARVRALGEVLRLGPADRVQSSLPATDLLTAAVLLAAGSAGAVDAAPATLRIETPATLVPLLRALGERRVARRMAHRLPTLSRRLFEKDRGTLRHVVVTGTTLPAEDRALLQTAGIAVTALYGGVEAGGPVAVDSDGSGYRPLADLVLDVRDADAQGWGELLVGGQPTGDRARHLPDGRLDIAGRAATALARDGGTVQAETLETYYGRHPMIADIAVTTHAGHPVALVRPDLDVIRASATTRIDDATRIALAEIANGRPRNEQLSGYVLVRRPLARTRRGEPVRIGLAERYAALLAGGGDAATELSSEDAALLADPTATKVWAWLRARFPVPSLSLDHSLQLDLAIDSLEWMTFALELEQVAGVPVDEEVMAGSATLRDLLTAVVERHGRPVPDRQATGGPGVLTEAQRHWISPRRWYHVVTGLIVYGIAWLVFRLPFRLKVEGREHVPQQGGVLIIGNHLSDLDPPILGVALPFGVVRRTYWAGEGTRLFSTPLARFLSRSCRIFPTQERVASASLAYAKALLDRGDAVAWFPESWRSPDGRLQRFMPGVGRIVADSDAMIVPARIVGTFEAMPRGVSFPRLHPVTVRFGPAIPAAEVIARAGGPGASHAEIAAVLHAEMAALPGEPPPDAEIVRRPASTISGSPLDHLGWALQAIPIWLAYGLLRLLPLDTAAGLGGRLARAIGPRLRLSERARRNLRRCWPDMAAGDVERIVAGMWDNLGRLVGEIVHLDKLRHDGRDPRIEIVGVEHVERMKHDGKPGIAFSAHLANWELGARVAGLLDLPVTLIYRQANNPWAEKLIQHCRGAERADLVPKGAEAAQRIVEAMRTGGHVGLVADQKTNNGIPAPFFGRTAMTTPVLAMCALAYDCPLFPVQVERLRGSRFRVTVHPPLDVPRTGNGDADRLAIATAVNAAIESWVRLRPEQWMWLHRRWPD